MAPRFLSFALHHVVLLMNVLVEFIVAFYGLLSPHPSPIRLPKPLSSTEATSLGDFYDLANGINWDIQTNWKTSEDACEWYGVECDIDGKVVGLNLKNNKINGRISSSIGLLTDLATIDLDSNYLTGSIPTEIGYLTSLRHFEVDDNQLTGSVPSEIANLANLKEVYVHTNNLSGSMPPELCARRIYFGGELDTLIADCSGNENNWGKADIICECCSMCF